MRPPILFLAALLAGCARPTVYPVGGRGPVVTVAEGEIRGAVDPSGVLVFRGIPYAAPPVGDLRWRPPQPAPRWSTVRPADRLGKNCMQAQPFADIDPYAAGVSEDCLYLNVWTPSLGDDDLLPVMVWIHGGGFFAGFGGEERHDGRWLAKNGAVVVTLNYRLGALGFLAHPALAAESPQRASGNYGLLDQVAALRWVRRNIAQFGGDPRRVTIFGESAGGMSVGQLIASPLARGLFDRAITESGVGLTTARKDSAEAQGVRFATALGVGNGMTDLAAALRAVPAETLLAASTRLRYASRPVVDGWVLPTTLDSAIARGRANLVPLITGSNRDEPMSWTGAQSRAIARMLEAKRTPVWVYQFTRAPEDSANRARGAYHSAEITFVFGRPHPIRPEAGRAQYDSTLADAMASYWVNFARSGDPNGRGLPRWPRYARATEAYLELGPRIVAKTNLRRAELDSLDIVARRGGEIRP